MDEYSVIDKRKCRYIIMDKSIPLAYAPYIGVEAVCLYLIYASLADYGVTSIESDAIKDFIGISEEKLKECNNTLEEYGLIKIENQEHDGKIVNKCYVLQTPPLPSTLAIDLRKKSLVKDILDEIVQISPSEMKVQPKRARSTLITIPKLINKFYSKAGNGSVDIFEREAGKKHINNLLKKGYSLEDIDFTIEWGFANARDEIDDISSIGNLIDRAIADREEHIAKRTKQAEEEAKRQYNEEIERKMVESYRMMMSDSEKKLLRERAMNIIRQDSRINLEFVTEQLIIIKENEIIRNEYLKKSGLIHQ
ncbi:MAG: hypothetical protein ACUVWN_06460 [bacterium]